MSSQVTQIRYKKDWFNPLFHIIQSIKADPEIQTVIIFGSKGSSKTFSVAQTCLIDMVHNGKSTLALRKEAARLEESLIATFRKCRYGLNLNSASKVMFRKFMAVWPEGNEAKIRFDGMDAGEDKIKGLEGIQNVVFDELDQFKPEEWEQAGISLRGGGGEQMLFGLLNPVSEENWVKKDFIDSFDWEDYIPSCGHTLSERSFIRRAKNKENGKLENVVLIKTVYLDNAYVVGGKHQDGTEYGKIDHELLRKYESLKYSNPYKYRINVLGEWGVIQAKRPFCYNFDMNKHVKQVEVRPDCFFFLSFDFNVEINAATLWQVDVPRKIVNCLMEFTPTLGIHAQCLKISRMLKSKTELPEAAGGLRVFITGDSTGNNRVNGSETAPLWRVVQNVMKIKDPARLWVATSNLQHNVSCDLVNHVLSTWNVSIDIKCTRLINDCMKAELYSNASGREVINKKAYDPHYLDTLRYVFQNVLHTAVKREMYE